MLAGARVKLWGLAPAFALLCLVFSLPGAAGAATLTVDSKADEPDLASGGGCATATGKCTLRAAIEEANAAAGGGEEIVFDGSVFDGGVDSAIILGEDLPPLTKPTTINGGRCTTDAAAEGPCVAVDGTNTGAVFTFEADDAAVESVAFFDASTGISVTGDEFDLRGNWFGVKLDGVVESAMVGTAIQVGAGSADGLIGGLTATAGNLFANGIWGVDIVGGSRIAIQGNRFGFGPDGTPDEAGYNKGISIASTDGEPAADNLIGGVLAPGAIATAACDGGCNLIAETEYTIGLSAEGGEGQAVDTTIVGNQLGIDAAGTGAAPNPGGIGGGIGTTVGGYGVGEGNRINGGSGIRVGGPDAAIIGNQMGVNAAGTEVFHPLSDGITIYDEDLTDPADEAVVADNVIGLEGGSGIDERGLGATIVDNEIIGAGSGLQISGNNHGHGSLIEGNLIEGSEWVGAMIENDFNEILGNAVIGAGLGGVEIIGRNGIAAAGNRVGGDSAADENEISLTEDAIVLAGAEGSENEVARNHGWGNDGQFIRLYEYEPGPIGPNSGIQPPVISSATAEGASGTAEPGARVRVFRKEGDEAGEIEGFLAEAEADAFGAWDVHYASLPGGTYIAATQTNVEGGTSELAFAKTPGGSEEPSGGESTRDPRHVPHVPPPADTTPPQTKISRGHVRARSADFRFDSGEQGAIFQCRLDRKRFRPCSSPKRYRRLAPGKHRFEVRAVDAAGNADPSPARRVFAVPPKRR